MKKSIFAFVTLVVGISGLCVSAGYTFSNNLFTLLIIGGVIAFILLAIAVAVSGLDNVTYTFLSLAGIAMAMFPLVCISVDGFAETYSNTGMAFLGYVFGPVAIWGAIANLMNKK